MFTLFNYLEDGSVLESNASRFLSNWYHLQSGYNSELFPPPKLKMNLKYDLEKYFEITYHKEGIASLYLNCLFATAQPVFSTRVLPIP